MAAYTVEQSELAHVLTTDRKSAPLWFLVRLYLGYEWATAGWEKISDPTWFGAHAGSSIRSFVQGALSKTTGAHPDVQLWYATFLQHLVLAHPVVWSNLISLGEFAVGLGLIVGLFTATAAFFGFFMNLNYLLAGTVSVNPIWLVLALGIMLAHRTAGRWGLDRYVQPFLRHLAHSRRHHSH